MCQQAEELQTEWYPQVGDWFSTKSSYCYEDSEECINTQPCEDCLGHSNVFVISDKYDFHSSVGGTKWYFGGQSCIRGLGSRMNSTSCYVMTKEDMPYGNNDYDTKSYKNYNWIPRTDQFINKLKSYWNTSENAALFNFLDMTSSKLVVNGTEIELDTLEKQLLVNYMELKYNKLWNGINWIDYPNVRKIENEED